MTAAGDKHAGRVFYVQYTNPAAYPPIEHSAHILADAGFDVRLLGTGIMGEALQFKPHRRIRLTLRPFRRAGLGQKLHYAAFVLHAIGQTLRWRPTWIYASDPLSCPIALVLSYVSTARVIYHEHDSPDADAGATRPSPFMRMVLRARSAVARRAEMCILPNQQRSDAFRRDTGCGAVLTVWNCPMREDVAPPRTEPPSGRLRVLYHGSIVPSRLPATIIDALGRLPAGVTLVIAGYETAGHAGYVRTLLEMAAARGIADRVVSVGTVPRRQDLMRQCATCDVGLALLPSDSTDSNERAMVGASNKPFDYLANGLPVLVADLPVWRETFAQAGFGRVCDPASSDSIAGALQWFFDHPAARLAMGEAGRQQIGEAWNYETVFAPVLARMSAGAPVSPRLRTPAPAGL